MKNNALILWLLVAIVALSNSVAVGQSLGGKRFQGLSQSRFATATVLNPDSALPAGVYTVGQAGSFPSIDSAFNKLNRDGILGNVTLTLIDTLYEALHGRRFELGSVAGAGPAARITIRPAVGKYVTVRGDSDAVFVFHNTKYLTLDGRSSPPSPAAGIFVHALYNPAASWNDCVDAWGDADHNEFLYLKLKTDDPRSAVGQGADCIGLIGEGVNTPDNNLVEGNLTSGTIGIYISGWSFAYRPQYNVIRKNTVGAASDLLGTRGITSEFADGTVIDGNTVQFLRRAAFPDYTIGINAYCNANTIIRNNVVHSLFGSSGARVDAILGSGNTTEIGQGLQIYNNMVYDLQNTSATGNGYIGGIVLWRNNNILVAYNTVKLSGTGLNPIGIDALGFDVGCTNVTIRNNILVNTYHQTAGGGCTALWLDQATTFATDYNDFHIDTTFANSSTVVHWNVNNYRTLNNWQGAGYDPHSVSLMPPFVGPNDLHIAYVLTAIADGATPLPGISGDIDGNARPHTGHSRPDIGADEFDHPPIDDVEEVGGIPRSFALGQNYPNPFNPVTNFQFSIVDRQLTILKVFDMLGREVATLVNEVKQPGTYSVQWDASKVASGVYFYRLIAGEYLQQRKMLLLR